MRTPTVQSLSVIFKIEKVPVRTQAFYQRPSQKYIRIIEINILNKDKVFLK
ncbi:hypothetical protein LEP1GSC188_2865 [Leptospira weilii serovar Topaz str. LT2116]|uniref:Uncharacterized protein n=1 Tax=Leptospira weilii serovar Topaz str. LT2116 TaxID=1088540 RepID=M3FRU0_9LEPT|nr:hypothetical protein LEP1GSC188_2865 [Leptospira weilii serovar Topaz str. LT2116]